MVKKIYIAVSLILISMSFIYFYDYDQKPIKCNIETKYLPKDFSGERFKYMDVYKDERHDFIKAIIENNTIQDWHIVIEDCQVKEFYESSKKFILTNEYRKELINRGLI